MTYMRNAANDPNTILFWLCANVKSRSLHCAEHGNTSDLQLCTFQAFIECEIHPRKYYSTDLNWGAIDARMLRLNGPILVSHQVSLPISQTGSMHKHQQQHDETLSFSNESSMLIDPGFFILGCTRQVLWSFTLQASAWEESCSKDCWKGDASLILTGRMHPIFR